MTISGTTRLFGILADPIHHVKTPQAINALMAGQGVDAVMVALHVGADGLAALLEGLRQLRNLDGFVVTVPHKTAMATLCDELTPAAAQVGAVNVVRRLPDGRLRGDILDGSGFVAGLRKAGIEPAGQRVYLAGAGGAGAAIAFALADAGVQQLTIANRSPTRAQELIERLVAAFPATDFALGTDDPAGHALVVNATSLGLRADDPLPLDVTRLTAEQTVAEIIMQPANTALLLAAQARGCRIHYGAPMLASQIALMAAFMQAAP
ncbi:shikimate 5-dehydrogenase [soil metagenome]